MDTESITLSKMIQTQKDKNPYFYFHLKTQACNTCVYVCKQKCGESLKNQQRGRKTESVGAKGAQEWAETMREKRGERLGRNYKKAVEEAEGGRREEEEPTKTCFLQKWHNDI